MSADEPARNADGTLTVPGRVEGPGGMIGDGMITIGPDDPAYLAWDRYLSRAETLAAEPAGAQGSITGQVTALAAAETATLSLEVTGPAEQVARFAQLCKTIQALCGAGASRTVQVDVDGDGDASLRFAFAPEDAADNVQAAGFDSDPVRIPGIGG